MPGLAARGRCRLRASAAERFVRGRDDPDPGHPTSPALDPRPAGGGLARLEQRPRGAFRRREPRVHFGPCRRHPEGGTEIGRVAERGPRGLGVGKVVRSGERQETCA